MEKHLTNNFKTSLISVFAFPFCCDSQLWCPCLCFWWARVMQEVSTTIRSRTVIFDTFSCALQVFWYLYCLDSDLLSYFICTFCIMLLSFLSLFAALLLWFKNLFSPLEFEYLSGSWSTYVFFLFSSYFSFPSSGTDIGYRIIPFRIVLHSAFLWHLCL